MDGKKPAPFSSPPRVHNGSVKKTLPVPIVYVWISDGKKQKNTSPHSALAAARARSCATRGSITRRNSPGANAAASMRAE